MKKRRLRKEEEKLWVKIYWSLIEKGMSHLKAFELAEKRIYENT